MQEAQSTTAQTPTAPSATPASAFEGLGAGNYEVNYTIRLKLCAGSVCFQMAGWAIYGEGPPGNYTYGVLTGRLPSIGDVVWEMWGAAEGNESYGLTRMCAGDLCTNETFLPVATRVAFEKPMGACDAIVNSTKLKGILSVRTHEAEFLDVHNGRANETSCFFNGIPLWSSIVITERERSAYIFIEAVWLRPFDEARFREILQVIKK